MKNDFDEVLWIASQIRSWLCYRATREITSDCATETTREITSECATGATLSRIILQYTRRHLC